ncbi:MAG: hypothetical protein AB1714_12620 [Acidobacteriota bacterium]
MPWRWFGVRDKRQGGDEEELVRRLLQAAAWHGEPPVPSPFFLARVRARIAASRPSPAPTSVGAAAWQMLPAFAIVVAIVTGWMGYESHRVEEAREEMIARLTQSESGAGDALMAATLLGSGAGTEGWKEVP